MYADRWSPRLRQGDVVGPIPYPKFRAPPQKVQKPQGWTADATINHSVELAADERYAVVVSHDCEFNDTKRKQFLVARLQDFSDNLSGETRAAIKAANDAIESDAEDKGLPEAGTQEPQERFDYIDTFVLEPVPGCFKVDRLAVFTTITALPMAMESVIRGSKRAELQHVHREQLRRKLGFFFGRSGDDDVPDEDKIDAPAPGA